LRSKKPDYRKTPTEVFCDTSSFITQPTDSDDSRGTLDFMSMFESPLPHLSDASSAMPFNTNVNGPILCILWHMVKQSISIYPDRCSIQEALVATVTAGVNRFPLFPLAQK
jgi:hypothetical protein